MAKYTKKTETDVDTDSVEIVVSDEPKKNTKKTTKKEETKRVFRQNDMIPCRSVVEGGLYLEGARTKMPYEWANYGAIEDVEYRDLVELVRTRSSYLFNPFFIVDDEDFVEESPALKKFYSDNYTVKELSDVLDLSVNEMIAELKTLPKTALDTLKSIAASQVSAGQIDSVRKIRALDEFFGTDLNLLSEFLQ